jgi:hypothetical protein
MENFILDLLKKSGADGWAVRDEIRTGWEFYFIRHALDQNRVRETEHITLTIYKAFEEDGTKFLGSASAELAPTATEAEAEGLIRSLLFEAGLTRNPAYTLNPPSGETEPLPAAPELKTIAGDFLRAQVFLHRHREVGAALDRGVVGDDHRKTLLAAFSGCLLKNIVRLRRETDFNATADRFENIGISHELYNVRHFRLL